MTATPDPSYSAAVAALSLLSTEAPQVRLPATVGAAPQAPPSARWPPAPAKLGGQLMLPTVSVGMQTRQVGSQERPLRVQPAATVQERPQANCPGRASMQALPVGQVVGSLGSQACVQ